MTADLMGTIEVGAMFAESLRGRPCQILGLPGGPIDVPVDAWARLATAEDDALLDHCHGAILDVGCGPGRMAARLAQIGHTSLGIDVVDHAVMLAQARGAAAQLRDVFQPLPGEGRWDTALLADGNIGIGGDPALLLKRLGQVLNERGRVVADISGPGTGLQLMELQLACAVERSDPFPWAAVGTDAIHELATAADLVVHSVIPNGRRHIAVLENTG